MVSREQQSYDSTEDASQCACDQHFTYDMTMQARVNINSVIASASSASTKISKLHQRSRTNIAMVEL